MIEIDGNCNFELQKKYWNIRYYDILLWKNASEKRNKVRLAAKMLARDPKKPFREEMDAALEPARRQIAKLKQVVSKMESDLVKSEKEIWMLISRFEQFCTDHEKEVTNAKNRLLKKIEKEKENPKLLVT